MTEVWKAIPGFEGYYEASDCGRVRGLNRVVLGRGGMKMTLKQRVLRTGNNGGPYPRATLMRESAVTRLTVHQAVASAFLGPCPPGKEVCHNDGDPMNNRVGNLRYDTPAANWADRHGHGTASPKIARWLEKGDVHTIRALLGCMSQRRIAERYGVHMSTINLIALYKNWPNVRLTSWVL